MACAGTGKGRIGADELEMDKARDLERSLSSTSEDDGYPSREEDEGTMLRMASVGLKRDCVGDADRVP